MQFDGTVVWHSWPAQWCFLHVVFAAQSRETQHVLLVGSLGMHEPRQQRFDDWSHVLFAPHTQYSGTDDWHECEVRSHQCLLQVVFVGHIALVQQVVELTFIWTHVVPQQMLFAGSHVVDVPQTQPAGTSV